MTVYSNKDVLYSKIEYRRQKYPNGIFILDDAIDIVPDDEIKIIGNYKEAAGSRTIVSGTNGVSGDGTAVFTSAGANFDTNGIVTGDMLIIKGAGADAGCYIVLTVDSETELTLDDHAGDPAVFNDESSLEYDVGLIIFRGIIDKTNFDATQIIEVISKADELDQYRPDETFTTTYSDLVLATLIEDNLTYVKVKKTESTLTIRPNAPDVEAVDWGDAAGNNDGHMWDDIDEEIADGAPIGSIGGTASYIGNLTTHSLAADYNYVITNAAIIFTAKKAITSEKTFVLQFYDGTDWSATQSQALTNNYVEYTKNFTIDVLESDIAAFQFHIAVNDGLGAVGSLDKLEVVLTYHYYDHFTPKAIYQQTFDLAGEKTLRDIANLLSLSELKTWYLDPDLYFHFNDGDIDSTEDFAKTDNLKHITGEQETKTYVQVDLRGGYTAGAQITAISGSGYPLWKDTYANITDQDTLDNLADQILTERSANTYTIQLLRRDNDGLYQVGETVSLPDAPDDIPFSTSATGSNRKIPTGEYILNKIDYILTKGVYNTLDIEIIDGLLYSKPIGKIVRVRQAEENSVSVSQVSAEGGEDNVGSNVGTDGVGVYKEKSGATLRFRHIAPASSKITVVLNGSDIDIDVAEGELDKYTQAQVDAHNWLEADITDLDKYTQAEVDALTYTLTGLTDTVLGGLVDNDILAYNFATAKWINQSPAEAGLLGLAGGEITGNITCAGGETFDTKDVSTLGTDAEAHAYVEANALTLTADVTFNAGQLFDTKDVSTLCTEAEAHDYVEGNALTMRNSIAMGGHDITGVDAVDGVDISAISITNMPTAVNNWKVYYTNGAGVMTELALGADDTYLHSNGAGVAPNFEAVAGGEGDNLGNHTATEDLILAGFNIGSSGIIRIEPEGNDGLGIMFRDNAYDSNITDFMHETASTGTAKGYIGRYGATIMPFKVAYVEQMFDDNGVLGSYQHVDDLQLLRELKEYEREKPMSIDFPDRKQKVWDINTLPWVKAHPDINALEFTDNKKRYSLPIGARDGYYLSTMKKLLEKIDLLEERINKLEG